MAFEEHWNNIYKNTTKKPHYDNWLDKYLDIILHTHSPILDLGCGTGNDTQYLIEKGMKVIACDYASEALKLIKKNIPSAETKLVDISQKLPFKDEQFEIIVADLSLHYFDTNSTKQIMLEIKRILKPNGHLFARVNSTNDINHGAGQGKKIEDNYYYVEGYNKRFFDMSDVDKFFSTIGEVTAHEAEMIRYEKPKKLIEIVVKKDSKR